MKKSENLCFVCHKNVIKMATSYFERIKLWEVFEDDKCVNYQNQQQIYAQKLNNKTFLFVFFSTHAINDRNKDHG